MNEQKFNEIVKRSSLKPETVKYLLFDYDWYNHDEHVEWVERADVAEIVGWLRAIEVADDWEES